MRKNPKGKYAWCVKIGEKGQFVIPKEARELFDIHPGDSILLLGDVRKGLAIPLKEAFAGLAARIFGDVPDGEEAAVPNADMPDDEETEAPMDASGSDGSET